MTVKPPRGRQGPGRRPMAEKGGECTVTINGGIRSHAERGAETSGGGWQVAGVGNIQVGGDSHRERKWGTGENRNMDKTMKDC